MKRTTEAMTALGVSVPGAVQAALGTEEIGKVLATSSTADGW